MAVRTYTAIDSFELDGKMVQIGEDIYLSERDGEALVKEHKVISGRALEPDNADDAPHIEAVAQKKEEKAAQLQEEEAVRDEQKEADLAEQDKKEAEEKAKAEAETAEATQAAEVNLEEGISEDTEKE